MKSHWFGYIVGVVIGLIIYPKLFGPKPPDLCTFDGISFSQTAGECRLEDARKAGALIFGLDDFSNNGYGLKEWCSKNPAVVNGL